MWGNYIKFMAIHNSITHFSVSVCHTIPYTHSVIVVLLCNLEKSGRRHVFTMWRMWLAALINHFSVIHNSCPGCVIILTSSRDEKLIQTKKKSLLWLESCAHVRQHSWGDVASATLGQKKKACVFTFHDFRRNNDKRNRTGSIYIW